MLKGISPLLSPELLANLCAMGHGDEIVLADAHFPGQSSNDNCIRADGLPIEPLLGAILPLFELDAYVDSPLVMMDVVEGDAADPEVEASYQQVADKQQPGAGKIIKIDRFAFYDRAKQAYAVVMTGDTRKYSNIILIKGVTPPN